MTDEQRVYRMIRARANTQMEPSRPTVRRYLRKAYGPGRWRKLKGIATVRLPNGALRMVEIHWYEAHGIGKRDLKIKRYLEES